MGHILLCGLILAVWMFFVGLSIGKVRGYADGFQAADRTIDQRGGMSVEERQKAKKLLEELKHGLRNRIERPVAGNF